MGSSIQDKINAGARVIDVRTREEYLNGHYRSAVNIPVGELAARLGEVGAKTDALVLYCA